MFVMLQTRKTQTGVHGEFLYRCPWFASSSDLGLHGLHQPLFFAAILIWMYTIPLSVYYLTCTCTLCYKIGRPRPEGLKSLWCRSPWFAQSRVYSTIRYNGRMRFNVFIQNMVLCSKCDRWYHYSCVSAPADISKISSEFECGQCWS